MARATLLTTGTPGADTARVLDKAERHLSEARTLCTSVGHPYRELDVLEVRARLEAAHGRKEEAAALLRTMRELARSLGARIYAEMSEALREELGC